MKKIIYTTLLAFLGLQLHAQLLLVENFNYGNNQDSLTKPSVGGLLWTTVNTLGRPITYLNSSLGFTGYPSSGQGGSISLLNSIFGGESARIHFGPVSTGPVYVSLLLNVASGGGNTGDYFLNLNDSTGSGIFGKLWIRSGSVGGKFKLGLSKRAGADSAAWSGDMEENHTYLVVLKAVLRPGLANDSVYAHIIDGPIPATEPLPSLIATDINTQVDLPQLSFLGLRQSTIGQQASTVDGIRVGLTWDESPLPVALTRFSGTALDNRVRLGWTTASELNNAGFGIERSSDGKQFESIGWVKGAGNSSIQLNYAYTDVMPVTGTNIYRLAQHDADGKVQYSESIVVQYGRQARIAGIEASSPNPFNTELNVSVRVAAPGMAQVELIDLLGKVHYDHAAQLQAGINLVSINTGNFDNGIYFVRISHGGETYIQKVIRK